jgi:hypothetical protein
MIAYTTDIGLVLTGLDARRDAALRLPPLPGGQRDPWPAPPAPPPDAAAAAKTLLHLTDLGLASVDAPATLGLSPAAAGAIFEAVRGQG